MFNALSIPSVLIGNGIATQGTYGFPALQASDVKLVKVDSNNVLTNLVYPTDYTLNGIGDPNSANWTFTLTSALASGYTVYGFPNIPSDQKNKFSQQGGNLASTIEQTVDRITVHLGQIEYALSRALLVTPGSTTTPNDFLNQLSAAVTAAQSSASAAAASATSINSNPAFRVGINTSNQTVPSGSDVKVTLTGESYDTNNCFDSTTNYRFTPNVAGYYLISAYTVFTASESGKTYTLIVKKNGSTAYSGLPQVSPGTALVGISLNDLIPMNGTTDYLELYVNHNSVSSKQLDHFNTIFAANWTRGL